MIWWQIVSPIQAAIANKAVLGQIELGQANEAVEAAVLHRLDAVVVQLQPLQLLEAGKHAGGHRLEAVPGQVEQFEMLQVCKSSVLDSENLVVLQIEFLQVRGRLEGVRTQALEAVLRQVELDRVGR